MHWLGFNTQRITSVRTGLQWRGEPCDSALARPGVPRRPDLRGRRNPHRPARTGPGRRPFDNLTAAPVTRSLIAFDHW